MLTLRLTSYLLIVFNLKSIMALPDGAPVSVCQTMLPFHGGGIPPSNTQSLFTVKPQQNVIGQGQILRIEIPSTIRDLSFKGFMIHARTTNGRVVGRFASSADGLVKLIDCSGLENTATHANTQPKIDFGLDWQAPSDYTGDVIFNATIAQDYDKFWVGEVSERVQVVDRDQVVTSGISTTRRPVQSTTPNFVRPTVKSQQTSDKIYDGCGDTKTCFGTPDGCVDTKSCQSFSAVIVKGERYIFEMRSSNRSSYIALGLSDDDKMGRDSVIECVNEAGAVKAYASWTIVESGKFDAMRTGIPQNTIRLLESRYENGQIYCQVERDPVTTVNGVKFDLPLNDYYLLLASGSALRPSTVDYHDIVRAASQKALRLSSVANVEGRSKVLLRLHGAFMITAWIGTASIGILLARYFKQTWVGGSMCGKDMWFAWHRICMVLTWALTMAAFIIIWLELRGWSAADNPHAILGTITTVICFFQPIGAFFRPHPGSKSRPIFNWSHWLGGNAAHILAIVTIFFSVKLSKAELPEWVDWILVAYVVFHVGMHLIYSIAGCVSDRTSNQRVSTFPMTDLNQRNQMMANAKQDAAFAGFRKVLFALYVFIVLIFVVALVVISVLAPIEETFKSKML